MDKKAVSGMMLTLLIILVSLLFGSQFSTAVTSDFGDSAANVVAETNMGYSLGTRGNQIFYHDGYWFVFYFNGSSLRSNDGAIIYKTSSDGESWSDPKITADDANISAYFSVYQFNDIVVVAYSSMPPADPKHNCVVRTRKGAVSGPTIVWDNPIVLLSGYDIGQTIGNFWGDYAFDKHWLAVEYLYSGSAYRCKIFSTTDFSSWNLSKDWQTHTSGYVFQVTLGYVEKSRLMALYGSWLLNEFSYMFYNGSSWSSEYQTLGSGLASGTYKAQCEVVVNGTMYMLYKLEAYSCDYVTNLKLAVYNGTWSFTDFLPDDRYWTEHTSSATFDRKTGTIYFFYVDAYKNEILAAYSTNYVDWHKDLKLLNTTFDTPRCTKTPRFCDGNPAVAWVEGSSAPFQIKFTAFSKPEHPLATINIDPDTLNLRSEGLWITAYIELPQGYNASDTDVSSIRLNETFSVDPTAPTQIGDYDSDGVSDLMVKFNRTELTSYLYNILEIKLDTVALTISGQLNDGTLFEGTDIIRVRLAGDVNEDRVVDVVDLSIAGRSFGARIEEDAYEEEIDFNSDGVINMRDLLLISINYGATIPE